MRRSVAVYTCVFGDYDKLFRPLVNDSRLEFFVFTDNADLKAPGWTVIVLNGGQYYENPALENRRLKILTPGILTSRFTHSLYTDGNIRLLPGASYLIWSWVANDFSLVLSSHPKRATVADECTACLVHKKVATFSDLHDEINFYQSHGFRDDCGLTENNVIFRAHGDSDLERLMVFWFDLTARFSGRDQISLPFALRKIDFEPKIKRVNLRIREPGANFRLYPHAGRGKMRSVWCSLNAQRHESGIREFIFQSSRLVFDIKSVFRRFIGEASAD